MMRIRTILIGSVLGGLLVAGFVGPAAVSSPVEHMQPTGYMQSAGHVKPAAGDGCVTVDEAGSQVWFGGANSNVTALGNELQDVVDRHPGKATGVALCSHFEGAAVFLATDNDDIRQTIAGIAAKRPDLKVLTRDVAAPLSTLIETSVQLLQSPDMKGLLVGGGPDIYTGGLLVSVAPDHGPLSDQDTLLIEETVQAINGSPLPLVYEQGGTAELSAP